MCQDNLGFDQLSATSGLSLEYLIKSVLEVSDVAIVVLEKCCFVEFVCFKLLLWAWLEETSFGIGEFVIL
jgi:hypothetical protein